jgi:hypothetical protein
MPGKDIKASLWDFNTPLLEKTRWTTVRSQTGSKWDNNVPDKLE